MRIFISGAASPLGRALVGALVKRGHRVVGLVRRVSGVAQMRELGAEPVLGDVRRPDSLVRALSGCDVVFHLASYFDFWDSDPEAFERVNVGGTRNVMAAAIIAKVRRVVLCSSAVTIGEVKGEVGDEFSRHRGHTVTEFERSKLAAERLALGLRPKGIEVVVVNPGLVVAPGDLGWTGRLIARCVGGDATVVAEAPLGWVWVDDAAEGLARAGESGVDGERYILCGEVMSSRKFLGRVARTAGMRPPRGLPRRLVLGEAMLATALARPFGRRPSLPLEEARFLTTGFKVDGGHAANALGLSYTPSTQYLPRVVEGYRSALQRFAKK